LTASINYKEQSLEYIGPYLYALSVVTCKGFKINSKTEYKAFTQLKQEHIIQFYVNIDHISLGKQSIANKYAPINTQNIGLI
jgi:hypothetical protein